MLALSDYSLPTLSNELKQKNDENEAKVVELTQAADKTPHCNSQRPSWGKIFDSVENPIATN